MQNIYIIGSLKNPRIPEIANNLRALGYEVFDDWFSAGPEADDKWQEYETRRGRTYKEALNGFHARDVFTFDKRHLDLCDIAILVMPAGKSGHLELGYCAGRGKRTYILFDQEPERYDIMPAFADDVFMGEAELLETLCLGK